MSSEKMRAVFVASNNALETSGGGVQLCTRDYVDVLRGGGFELQLVGFETAHDPVTRILNRLDGRGYWRMIPSSLGERVLAKVREADARFVFFNESDFTFLAAQLRKALKGGVALVHLSHGLRSTDVSIDQQSRRLLTRRTRFDGRAAKVLGARLQFEADYRCLLDASLCISPLDAELERWLGAAQTHWFPRPIREMRLNSVPVNGRIGCVATLEHIPNRNGFLRTFEALEQERTTEICVRLVGRPKEFGEELAARFRFVQYLGCLDDMQLRTEAETWCGFLHPIFDYARGCSTKVAVALGWGLPIATTFCGVRGYFWDDTILPIASTPSQLVHILVENARAEGFDRRRLQTGEIASMQPTLETLSCQMRAFLISLLGIRETLENK